MTDSTKVYAPDLGDLTILMALVNLFELVCKLATVFFAMINVFIIVPFFKGINLFYLFMNGHLSKNRIVFFQFDSLGSVLFIFCGNVT